ncbi:hypothetical protein NDU88_007067 [Pleurodeles waltl]|uniref:Uncharacterized protein n=1 Tax=Pleurodeles waltl TaxID=8319 RepID=A0AAV7RPT8_PLEWA|nr:hypothetical protein NDU88_007067 [Pleurodeles waltl]
MTGEDGPVLARSSPGHTPGRVLRPTGSAPLLWPEENLECVSCPLGNGTLGRRRKSERERVPRGARLSYGRKRTWNVCPVPLATGRLAGEENPKENASRGERASIMARREAGRCVLSPWQRDAWPAKKIRKRRTCI